VGCAHATMTVQPANTAHAQRLEVFVCFAPFADSHAARGSSARSPQSYDRSADLESHVGLPGARFRLDFGITGSASAHCRTLSLSSERGPSFTWPVRAMGPHFGGP
jgi:hypothetical protein